MIDVTIFHISIDPKNTADKRQFWFQKGKLTLNPDRSKSFQSWKDFSTKKKLESFLRWLDGECPDTVVHVWETRPGKKEWCYEIPMGDDWKEYHNEWIA